MIVAFFSSKISRCGLVTLERGRCFNSGLSGVVHCLADRFKHRSLIIRTPDLFN